MRHSRHQRNVALDPPIKQPKILFILSSPRNSCFSLRGLLEVLLREAGSAVQLACPLSLSSVHAAEEVLLRCYHACAKDLIVKIYNSSFAIGIVRWDDCQGLKNEYTDRAIKDMRGLREGLLKCGSLSLLVCLAFNSSSLIP